jgi:hypothetical protein
MKMPYRQLPIVLLLLLGVASRSLFAQCTLTESRRKFEGGQRTVVHMENERIIVEIVPELEGRVIRYVDKSRSSPTCGFEWLDDCPYHYGGRWEGVPFRYHVDAAGPDRAAVTVSGGGKIAVALLHHLTGADVANPLDLKVERTMSIVPHSTCLKIDVKITNAGEGVAPQFRYMVHAVFGDVPQIPGAGRAFWFLPTSKAVEFFDDKRGSREMGQAGGGSPMDHPFNRFTPGIRADKPRYEAGGWGALLTSGGPVYMFYDPKQFDFQQFWFGGDSEWHYTFEPHTRPIELKPGETTSASYTLSYDSKEVPFAGPTVAYELPSVPEALLPGGALTVKTRATTVRDQSERASLRFEAKDAKDQTLLARTIDGDVQPFTLTDLAADFKLPENAALGKYKWKTTAGDGREISSGTFEIVTADEQARRQIEKATAELKAEITLLKQQLQKKETESRRRDDLWKDGVDLALTWNDERFWSTGGAPAASVSISLDPAGVPVQGQWKKHEGVRIKSLVAPKPATFPADADKILSLLGADRPFVRDVAVDGDGKGLAVLLVNASKSKVEICRIRKSGVVRRFGQFSDKPTETDPAIGLGARAIAVDGSGNIWITTNAWGKTSLLVINQDGAPSEEAVIGAKGALKKFSPEGKLLNAIGLLAAPSDLAFASADGLPVILCAYRQVSTYHGTQVREGLLVVSVADGKRVSEIKVPAGSVTIDNAGRIWTADVAGHVACADVRGHKLFDVKNSPPPAVLEAVLPASSPLPAVVRPAAGGGVWVLSTLKRSVAVVATDGAAACLEVPESAGALYRMTAEQDGVMIVGDKGLWKKR